MTSVVVIVEGDECILHGVLNDGSATYCGRPVHDQAHFRDLLTLGARHCGPCFDLTSYKQTAEPVDDDPAF